jgi:hypothetical protein
MIVTDKPRFLLAAGLAILFAAALWFRVSSLGAHPWHSADESYYGVQAAHLLRGEAFAVRTPSQSVTNPFLIALQVPFHLISRPSVWVLRAPAVICGILAIVLTYLMGARALDRGTAQIATVLMATLPCVVYQSRIGLEQSQLPLFGILVVAFALRGHGLGLLLSFLASMLVHPTAIFLIPVALPIFLVQLARKGPGDPVGRRRILVGSTLVSLLVAAAISIVIFNHPMTRAYLARRPPLDWADFLDGYERNLFFLYDGISVKAIRLHRWVFRGLFLTLLVLGTGRLVRRRQWERLALIAGLAASLAIFHFVAGPRMLKVYVTYRYGFVFAVPTVLAFSCLMQALMPSHSPEELPARARPRLPLAVALAIGWALLLSVKVNQFDPMLAKIGESLWTFQPDGKDEFDRALSLIRRDVARTRAGGNSAGMPAAGSAKPVPIIVQDYWALMPLAYLAGSNPHLEVVRLIDDDAWGRDSLENIVREKSRELGDRVRAGAYVVERVGTPDVWGSKVIDDTVKSSFPAGSVRRWEVPNRCGMPALIVYRLKDGPDPLASSVDATGVRRDSTLR